MPTHPMTRGDTSPALRYDLIPATVDLTGASVTFSMRGVLDRARAEVISASPPVVQYNWQRGDTDRPGVYRADFTVTFPSGVIETFPPATGPDVLAVHIAEGAATPVPVGLLYIIGETVAEPLTFSDDAGEALDLTGMTLTALVATPTGTVEHPLTIHDPLIGEAWPAWGDLNLPAGTYSVRIRMALPDGSVDIGDDPISLQVVTA